MVSADALSSHWASSITHRSGCSAAASESRLSTASPTTKRSAGAFAPSPNAVSSASRCGPGSRSKQVEHRRAQLMQAREGKLHLVLDAGRLRQATAGRALLHVAQQRRLPDPRLAADDQYLALARPDAAQQSVERRALADPVVQHVLASRAWRPVRVKRVRTTIQAAQDGTAQNCRRDVIPSP